MKPDVLGRVVQEHPELKNYVRLRVLIPGDSFCHCLIAGLPVHSTQKRRIETELITFELFDLFYSLAKVPDEKEELSWLKHQDYFLVWYDDGHGNTNPSFWDGPRCLPEYLKERGFSCKAGYWGCPWYFVDIKNKIFLPGRPGVSYGEVIGGHDITFAEFKSIYSIYERYAENRILWRRK